jgi:hypothetical protein
VNGYGYIRAPSSVHDTKRSYPCTIYRAPFQVNRSTEVYIQVDGSELLLKAPIISSRVWYDGLLPNPYIRGLNFRIRGLNVDIRAWIRIIIKRAKYSFLCSIWRILPNPCIRWLNIPIRGPNVHIRAWILIIMKCANYSFSCSIWRIWPNPYIRWPNVVIRGPNVYIRAWIRISIWSCEM